MEKIWKVQDNNLENTFRTVLASFIGYFRPQRFENLNQESMSLWYELNNRGIQIVRSIVSKHLKKFNQGFEIGIDFLENPFHALKEIQQYFGRYHENFIGDNHSYREGKVILMDSGGLQLFRAKKGLITDNPERVLKSLHSEIFPIQAKANLAFAFDHIIDNFTYEDIKQSALKTVENIKEQLKIFDDVDGQASLLPIFSPVFNFKALDIWEDILIDNLPWDNPRLQSGISFGGLLGGNITQYNKSLTYYLIANIFRIENKLKKVFGKDYEIPFIHLLGFSDRRTTYIVYLLVIDKYFKTISADGRSFSMNFVVGKANRYINKHLIRFNKIGKSERFRNLVLENLMLFEDIIKDHFPYKDAHNFDTYIRHILNYYDINKRNDKNKLFYESMVIMEAYNSLLNTLMYNIERLEEEIDEHRNKIEICKNNPDEAVRLFLNFSKDFIQTNNAQNIDIHELI